MDTILTNFDAESKAFIDELAEEGINIDNLIKKLYKAKRKVNKEGKFAEALESKIKK